MSHGNPGQPHAPRTLVIAAFGAIYVIWGSTYLAIRFAVETMPPFMMAGFRFLLAGAVLFGWLRWRGARTPDPAHWKNAAIIGTLLLGIGNGFINWAEQKVASSVVALMIAVTPLWFALLDWLRPGGHRPRVQTMIGILIGFLGMAWLVGPHAQVDPSGLDLAGIAAVLAASIGWVSGSLYSRYTPRPEPALMAGALQMLAGGTILTIAGLMCGEAERFSIYHVSARSLGAFIYLTTIGSLVGFPAYNYLLKVSTPARVSTYAYVNPVIAVLLGCAFGGESLTARMTGAAVVIILGVIVITTSAAQPSPERTPLPVRVPSRSTSAGTEEKKQ